MEPLNVILLTSFGFLCGLSVKAGWLYRVTKPLPYELPPEPVAKPITIRPAPMPVVVKSLPLRDISGVFEVAPKSVDRVA
jgi:hypothetical protein